MISNSRACDIESLIHARNEELTFVKLSEYTKFTSETPILKKMFFNRIKENARRIKKNIIFLAKLKKVSRERESGKSVEVPLKRKTSSFPTYVVPSKRILKTYRARKERVRKSDFEKDFIEGFKAEQSHVVNKEKRYRVFIGRNIKKIVAVKALPQSKSTFKKNRNKNFELNLTKKTPSPMRRKRLPMKLNLWNFVMPHLTSVEIGQRENRGEFEPKKPVKHVEAPNLFMAEGVVKETPSAEERKLDSGPVVEPSKVFSWTMDFEDKPATWLSLLKKSNLSGRKRKRDPINEKKNMNNLVIPNSTKTDRCLKAKLSQKKPIIKRSPSEQLVEFFKREQNIKFPINEREEVPETKSEVPEFVLWDLEESSLRNNLGLDDVEISEHSMAMRTVKTAISEETSLFGVFDSEMFVHDLFAQKFCLFCGSHAETYVWSSSKRKRLGNFKNHFPKFFWQSRFGRISINFIAEVLDWYVAFPFKVFADFFCHFIKPRGNLEFAFVTKLYRYFFGKELLIYISSAHSETSFTPLFSSVKQWLLIVPKNMLKLCARNSEESNTFLKKVVVGWMTIFTLVFVTTAIVCRIVRFALAKTFSPIFNMFSVRNAQSLNFEKSEWSVEFLKKLLGPCTHKNWLSRNLCKIDKVFKLFDAISNDGRQSEIDIDSVFGDKEVGFYPTFTWWSYLVSSMVCVQGIAKVYVDYGHAVHSSNTSFVSVIMILARFLLHVSFLIANTIVVSRFLSKGVLEMASAVVLITVVCFLCSKALTHVFSFDCGWTTSCVKTGIDANAFKNEGTRAKKGDKIVLKPEDSRIVFSSKGASHNSARKYNLLYTIINYGKNISEILLVGCAFLWLMSSISNPYKFYLRKGGLRLFFGSSGGKFLRLNVASIIVVMLGFSENFSVVLSPVLFLAYLCYEYRVDIMQYFHGDLQNLFRNVTSLSTIVLHYPGVGKFFNLELLSLLVLLLAEYVLAFFQLSASRIMSKFHVATFRFLNIYLVYMVILSIKTFLGNYIEILSTSGLVWLILAIFTRTSAGTSLLVKTNAAVDQNDANHVEAVRGWSLQFTSGVKVSEVKQGHSSFAKFLIQVCNLVLEKLTLFSRVVGVKVLDFGARRIDGVAGFRKGLQKQFDYSNTKIVRMRKMCPTTCEVGHNDMFAFEVNGSIVSASHVLKEKVIYDATPDEIFKMISQSKNLKKFLDEVAKHESFRDTYTDQVAFGLAPVYTEPPNGMPIFTPTPEGDIKLGVVRSCVTSNMDDEGLCVRTLGSKRIFYPHVKQGMSGLPIICPTGVVGSCGTHEVVPTQIFPNVVESVPGIKEFSGLCRIPIQDIKASEIMSKACQTSKYSRFDLVAQTGSGKSTIFPVKLALTNGGKKVVLITPRVSAAMNAYNRIILLIEEAGLDLECGLITGPRKEGTLGSNILIFTIGSFLFLLGFGGLDLDEADVILDEVHVHEGPTMCTLDILQKKLEARQFGRFFTATATPVGCSISDLNPNADNFPVEMVQVDCDATIDNHLLSNLTNVCKTVMKHSQQVNMIFLPTISSLSTLANKLMEVNGELMKSASRVNRLKIFKVHSLNMVSQLPLMRKDIHDLRRRSSMPTKQRSTDSNGVFTHLPFDKIFILTTNCLETGVTLDLDVVFSSGMVVSEKYDGVSSISLCKRPISTQEFIQQRGRVGRIKPGKCVYFHLKKDPYMSKLSYLPGDIDFAYSWATFLGYGEDIKMKNQLAKELSKKDRVWHRNVLLSPYRPITALYHTTDDGKFSELALELSKISKSFGEVLAGKPEVNCNVPEQQIFVNLARFQKNDLESFLQVIKKYGVKVEGKINSNSTVCVTYRSTFIMSSLHILQVAILAEKIEQSSFARRTTGTKQHDDPVVRKIGKRTRRPDHQSVSAEVLETSVSTLKDAETKECWSSEPIVVIVEKVPLHEFLSVRREMREFLADIFKISVSHTGVDPSYSTVEYSDINKIDSCGKMGRNTDDFQTELVSKLRKYNPEQEDFDNLNEQMLRTENISLDPLSNSPCNGSMSRNEEKMDFLDALKQKYRQPNRNLKTSNEYVRDWLDQLQFSHVGSLAIVFFSILFILAWVCFKSLSEAHHFIETWLNLSSVFGVNLSMFARVLVAFWYSTYFQKTSNYISKQKSQILARMSECLDSIKVVRRTSPFLAVVSHVLVYKFAKKEGKKVACKWRERIEPQLRLAGGGLNLKAMSRDCEAVLEKTGVQESIDQALFATAFDPKLLIVLLIFSPMTLLVALLLSVGLKMFVLIRTATPIIWIVYSFPLASSITSLVQGNSLSSLLFLLSMFSSHVSGIFGDVATAFIRGLCLTTSTGDGFLYQGSAEERSMKDDMEMYFRDVVNNDSYQQTPFGLLKADPLDGMESGFHKYVKFENVKRKYSIPPNLSVPPIQDLGMFDHGERRQGVVAAYLLENCPSWFQNPVIDVTAGKHAEFCRSLSRRLVNRSVQAISRETNFSGKGNEICIRRVSPDYDIEKVGILQPFVKEALYIISYSRKYPPNLEYVTKNSEALSRLLTVLSSQKPSMLANRIKLLVKLDEYLCMQNLNLFTSLALGSYPTACLDPLKPFQLPTLWICFDFSRRWLYSPDMYENWFNGLAVLQCNRAKYFTDILYTSRKKEAILRFIRTRDQTFHKNLVHDGNEVSNRTPDPRCANLPSLRELGISGLQGQVFCSSISNLKNLGYTVTKPKNGERYCGFEVVAHCKGIARGGSNGPHAPSSFKTWIEEETLIPTDEFTIDFADEWDRAVEKAILTRMNKVCPASMRFFNELETTFKQFTEVVLEKLAGNRVGPLSWEELNSQVNRASTMGKIDKLALGHRKVGDFMDDVDAKRMVNLCSQKYSQQPACLDTIYYLFPKDEKRFFESRHIVDGVKVPRLISMHGGVMRVTETMLFSRLSDVLYGSNKLLIQGFPLFTNGLSKPEVARLVVSLTDKYKCNATEDFSAWDASITPALQILEYQFWNAICTEELKIPLKNYFLQDMLKLCCGPGGEIFKVYGQRASGAWNTSAGNGLINLVLQLTRIRRVFGNIPLTRVFSDHKCHVLVEGDDSIIFGEQEFLEGFFRQGDLVTDAGFALKRSADPIKYRPEEATYLSHGYTRIQDVLGGRATYWPIRSLDVIVQRLCFLRRYNARKMKRNKINEANMLFSALIDYFPIRGLRSAIINKLAEMRLSAQHFIEIGKKYDGLKIRRFLPCELPRILEEIHNISFPDLQLLELGENAKVIVDGDIVQDVDFCEVTQFSFMELLASMNSTPDAIWSGDQIACETFGSVPAERRAFLLMRAFSRTYMKALNMPPSDRRVVAAKYLLANTRWRDPRDKEKYERVALEGEQNIQVVNENPLWGLIINAI
jgi:hypothetical protein